MLNCVWSLKSNLMLAAVHDLTCKLEPINEHLSNMFSGRKCSDSMKSVTFLSALLNREIWSDIRSAY